MDPSTLATRLVDLGQYLICDTPESGLRKYAKAAHALLLEVEFSCFLTELLGERSSQVIGRLSGWRHLGFVAPPGSTLQGLERVFREAGFSYSQSVFKSEILAIELAQAAGLKQVPTTIVKGFHPWVGRDVLGLEAFLAEVDPKICNDWVLRGQGVHIGIGMKGHDDVRKACELAQSRGFQPPKFMGCNVALNESEKILVTYLDGTIEEKRLRVEFYHAESEKLAGDSRTSRS